MPNFLSKERKNQIKGSIKRARSWLLKNIVGFDKGDLVSAFARLGLQIGDRVLVHSSFDAFVAFDGGPSDVVRSLQAAVGPSGTIVMPTMPFDGTAIEHARLRKVFDVRRTPSRMGLVTEIFRRSPGVIRSVHPTHPVAVWGADADTLIADHHRATTPCGSGTPYARLADLNGKILLLGVSIDSMTYFHTLEEELEPGMPVSPFTTEVFTLQSKDAAGTMVETRTRLFNPALSARRRLSALRRPLIDHASWAETRLGNVRIVLLKMADVTEVCRSLAARGQYCYEGL